MKKCPYCAEEMQETAVVCKHCGLNLPALVPTTDLTLRKAALQKQLERYRSVGY